MILGMQRKAIGLFVQWLKDNGYTLRDRLGKDVDLDVTMESYVGAPPSTWP